MKLQNESNNLEEISAALVAGKKVQFKSTQTSWEDYEPEMHRGIFCLVMLKQQWRKKPDAFEEVWEQCESRGFHDFLDDKDMAKHFWNAAMEHKSDE